MSDERIERIERELRAAPGPRETAGRGRQLPADVREARRLLSQIDGRRNAARVVVRAGAIGLAAAAAVAVAIAIGATRPGIIPVGRETATPQPTSTPEATPAATPAASQGPAACMASDLRAVADRWGGAAGSRGTTIHVTLASGPDCVLQGHPGARIVDSDGSEVIASLDPAKRPDHPWMEPGEQAITLSIDGPGTTVSVTWGNWCPAAPSQPHLELRVATDGPQLPVTMTPGDTIPIPPCLGSGEPSTLSSYPFGG